MKKTLLAFVLLVATAAAAQTTVHGSGHGPGSFSYGQTSAGISNVLFYPPLNSGWANFTGMGGCSSPGSCPATNCPDGYGPGSACSPFVNGFGLEISMVHAESTARTGPVAGTCSATDGSCECDVDLLAPTSTCYVHSYNWATIDGTSNWGIGNWVRGKFGPAPGAYKNIVLYLPSVGDAANANTSTPAYVTSSGYEALIAGAFGSGYGPTPLLNDQKDSCSTFKGWLSSAGSNIPGYSGVTESSSGLITVTISNTQTWSASNMTSMTSAHAGDTIYAKGFTVGTDANCTAGCAVVSATDTNFTYQSPACSVSGCSTTPPTGGEIISKQLSGIAPWAKTLLAAKHTFLKAASDHFGAAYTGGDGSTNHSAQFANSYFRGGAFGNEVWVPCLSSYQNATHIPSPYTLTSTADTAGDASHVNFIDYYKGEVDAELAAGYTMQTSMDVNDLDNGSVNGWRYAVLEWQYLQGQKDIKGRYIIYDTNGLGQGFAQYANQGDAYAYFKQSPVGTPNPADTSTYASGDWTSAANAFAGTYQDLVLQQVNDSWYLGSCCGVPGFGYAGNLPDWMNFAVAPRPIGSTTGARNGLRRLELYTDDAELAFNPLYCVNPSGGVCGAGSFAPSGGHGITAQMQYDQFMHVGVSGYSCPIMVDATGSVGKGDCSWARAIANASSGLTATATRMVDRRLFGINVQHPGTTWPLTALDGHDMRVGGLRLWDSNVGWADVETCAAASGSPSDPCFTWTNLDTWVNTNAPTMGVDILYTVGYTPPWATCDTVGCQPTPACASAPANYYGCLPPTDVASDGSGSDTIFKNFITALVTRYTGKINYYELWNEADTPVNFAGTTAQIIAMTRDEAAIIRSLDPAAKILSPSFHWGSAVSWFQNQYLANGGAAYFDIVNAHLRSSGGCGSNVNPEGFVCAYTTVHNVIVSNGLTALPFWDDEAGSVTGIADTDNQASYVARFFALRAAYLPRAYWSQWDSGAPYGLLSSIASTAMYQVYTWLDGKAPSACVQVSTFWSCDLTGANGYAGQIIWDTSQTCSSGTCSTANHTVDARFLRYRDIAGDAPASIVANSVPVGLKPVLLENVP